MNKNVNKITQQYYTDMQLPWLHFPWEVCNYFVSAGSMYINEILLFAKNVCVQGQWA